MKNSIKVLAFAAAILVAQSCGSKIEKSTEDEATKTAATEDKTASATTLEERRAAMRESATILLEKRKLEREKLAAVSLTFVDIKGEEVYHKAEVNPSFVGGDDAMMAYLRENVVFPKQAEKDELEGTVIVDFVVGKDGVVRSIEVTDATSTVVDDSFRNEAVRVVSSMPKWLPGRQNEKPVSVKYSIPISFQMI